MNADKRKHERIKPQSLTANITIFAPSNDSEIHLEGLVLDMSTAGIKIKLFSAMPENIPKSKIRINLLMPKSGLPLTIKGVIKRLDNNSECGIQYYKDNPNKEIDNLLFECIKSV
ncbi:PilZ domain-containing protein [Pseudocolwellia sp. AS88]|uniref:PilZ domain-containing protein n=1 Tax=Pseudocolwellia TaxID=2848177 RepID=UPI0026EF924C|nr:PilZ domain-containing protein [Pseudocolwellia sp. AS88]MDO7083291.1 PilZ domain-containing protein [Pseudocolwellia sp. AS88]